MFRINYFMMPGLGTVVLKERYPAAFSKSP